MKNYFNSLKKSVWVVSSLCLLVSCNDVWENHYSTDSSIVPDKNLAERIEAEGGNENFIAALKTTKMFNGNKILDLTYYDFLSSDQFLTVWVPSAESVSEEDWALYTKENKTYEENKNVGQQFLMNHIARFSHPVGLSTNDRVRMLSKKRYLSVAEDIAGVSYEETNLACTNGILHLLDGVMPYRQTIYEYITETPGYEDNLGAFFEKYTIDEVDDNRSIISGVDGNGEPIYIDSVTYKYSIIMNEFGHISEEDSNYVVVLPTPETWVEMYDSVKKQFNFTTMLAADSLQEYYTHCKLLTDMFFNMNIQRHPQDSVMSTLYYEGVERVEDALQHKYYDPYGPEGLFKKNVVDTIICSNGIIYLTDGWSFDKSEIIDRNLKVEGESTYNLKITDNIVTRTQIMRDAPGKPKISNEYLLELSCNTTNWEYSYSVYDNLKGKYKLGIVTVRESLINSKVKEDKQVNFHPSVSYGNVVLLKNVDRRKRPVFIQTNVDVPVDTLWVPGVAEIPQANYGQDKAKLEVKVEVKATGDYSQVMFLDCIILKPVPDDYEDPIVEE